MMQTRQGANWRWMIPILMLILAALACDEPYIDPPHVAQVEVDASTPGHAFSRIISATSEIDATYETDDYGQHWWLSTYDWSATTPPESRFTMSGETLSMDGHPVWSFPRPIFRFFFFDDSGVDGQRFALPYGSVSAGFQGDRFYAAMGSEGVLVGRLTAAGAVQDWQLTANGIDVLHPLSLTITNPAEVLGVTALALFVPPYGLIHGFLLYCLWVYLLPREKARHFALLTTLSLMAAAAAATVIWLTDVRTDYFPVVGIMAAITALTGVSLTLVFADEQTAAPKKHWLVLAALLASLVVPAGIAAIFVGWWAVYGLAFGYLFFRRAFYHHLQPDGANWRERWLADRLALEMVGMGALIVTASSFVTSFFLGAVQSLFRYGAFLELVRLTGIIFTIGLSMVLLGRYAAFRLEKLTKAKRGEDTSAFPSLRLGGDVRLAVLGWMIASGILSAGTFMGQLMAYSWFTTLLK